MSFLGKLYKYEREENFKDFLVAAGLPEEQINNLLAFKPTSKLVKDGDAYTYISSTTEGGTKETKFKSGVEFEDNFQEKIPIKTTYTVDGNKVTQVVSTPMGSGVFVREYNGDELVVTITGEKFDGVAKRFYKLA